MKIGFEFGSPPRFPWQYPPLKLLVKTSLPRSATTLVLLAALPSLNAQVFFDRDDIMIAAGWKQGDPITGDITPQKTYQNPRWREKMLRQFPAADEDRDGKLTEQEAMLFHLRRVRRFTPQGGELEYLGTGASHWTERVPMRDGQSLPVEVYLPGGAGPWPVVLIRTARGRIDSALDYGNELVRAGYAVVGGDLTPEGDFVSADLLGRETPGKEMSREDRAALNSRRSRRNSGEDGVDTIAWIARQSWSNGRIGMTGYSEASMQTKNALALRPPELKLVVTGIGSRGRPGESPFSGVGARVNWQNGSYPPLSGGWTPPTPAVTPLDSQVAESDTPPDVFYNDRTGWFDYAGRHSIAEWNRMRANGKSTLVMGIGGHGRLSDAARLPPAYGDCDIVLPEIGEFAWLRDKDPSLAKSRLYYFLMGDASNPDAPGNVWKVTETWPVADKEMSWFLQPDRSIGKAIPTGEAKVDYVHNPLTPVETLNGAHSPSSQYGPRDQRPLDGRDDVLLFTSGPLDAPLEITGEAWVDLYVSTDAPDTQFIVQLLDIYPDGYKWPIRESGLVMRFRDGANNPQPLESGKVYHVKIPLDATALVLDRGHRLGLQVMSSSYPTYPVHPNKWDAIADYQESRRAHQTIHISPAHPSRIVLPIVTSPVKDYSMSRDEN